MRSCVKCVLQGVSFQRDNPNRS
uniref:Uncharacterized protein n=1 Tax=Anopheles dirus TaxID=7168 RepID=A0A182NWM3_9DIPT